MPRTKSPNFQNTELDIVKFIVINSMNQTDYSISYREQTIVSVELRQASVKGAIKGELSSAYAQAAHGGTFNTQNQALGF